MPYTVVEGVIGVGKTALARLLGQRLGLPTFFEQFEANPFLGNFYSDRARYAFQTEVFFLLNRYRQQQSEVKPMLTASSGLVGDYLFAKTRLFAGLNLEGDEMALFEQIYEALSRQVPRPDLVVYLQASLDTLMARIYQRDRTFERNMERAYIAHLSRLYDDFFDRYDEAPVLRIETDDLDLIRDSAAQGEVMASISAALAPGAEGA